MKGIFRPGCDWTLNPQGAGRAVDAPGSSLAAQLATLVDALLVAVVLVFPYAMGGRHPVGELVLVALVGALATAWFARQVWLEERRWHGVGVLPMTLLAAAIVLVVVQLISLPQAVLHVVSPAQREILPLWQADAEPSSRLGIWSTASLTPALTRAGLTLLVAYALLFVVVVQRLRTLADLQWMLRWISVSVAVMGAFGIVQYLTGNSKFLWFYEFADRHTRDSVKGTFINRNHFAHFLALGVGPCLWWVQDAVGRRRAVSKQVCVARRPEATHRWRLEAAPPWLPIAALTLTIFAGLSSISRGGAISIVVAVLIVALLYRRARLLRPRALLALALATSVAGAALAISGFDRLAGRLETVATTDLDTIDHNAARRIIWETDAQAIPHFLLLGSGVGSHSSVYHPFLTEPWEFEFTHAENGYLQILLETGLPGLLLLLAGIALVARWAVGAWRNAADPRLIACVGAVIPSIVVSLLHSLVDFPWYIPACMALTVLLLAVLLRLWQMTREGGIEATTAAAIGSRTTRSFPRPAWIGAAALVALTSLWMVTDRYAPATAAPYWDRYKCLERDYQQFQRAAHFEAIARASQAEAEGKTEVDAERASAQSSASPQGSEHGQTDRNHLESLQYLDAIIAQLEEVVAWDPENARANARLAESYVRRFDMTRLTAPNTMLVADVCDTVFKSRFASKEELDAWLARAFAPHRVDLIRLAYRQARLALQAEPALADAYLSLARTCFLAGSSPQVQSKYVDQALVVDPNSGDVLAEAARVALYHGDYRKGLDLYARSFRCGRVHQERIINTLAGVLPVPMLVESFDFDLESFATLHRRLKQLNRYDQIAALLPIYVEAIRAAAESAQGGEAGKLWVSAHALYADIGDRGRALLCAQRAVQTAPNDYNARYALATALWKSERPIEAEEHMRWCVQRRPGNKYLQQQLTAIIQQRITAETRAARNPPTASSLR